MSCCGGQCSCEESADPVENALEIAFSYGQIDGSHHKSWVIDQMVRALTGDKYEEWVTEYKKGEDGAVTFEWDEGIAP